MSTVPAEIAGIGSTSQKLRVSPGFDPLKANVEPDEYFLFSRIDGNQTLREILLATGLPIERAIAIVVKLRSLGAVMLQGETGAGSASPPAAPPPAQPARTGTPLRPAAPPAPATATPARAPVATTVDVRLTDPTAAELAALAEPAELDDGERRLLLALARLSDGKDPHALLGVPRGADAKTLKRAYFLLSKDIHPDRFYGKQLGSFAERMATVFEAVSRAYAKLTNPGKPRANTASVTPEAPQTPQAYAAELFERACALEVSGDALEGMKLFAAAVRVDPQTRYLRRAASCALAAHQPKTALEYAKKAQTQSPDDPSSARLLAQAFRAAGKLADAEEVLVMAMAMKSENDVLTSELRNDLAEVRRLLAANPS